MVSRGCAVLGACVVAGACGPTAPVVSECHTMIDCAAMQHCLIDGDSGAGRCVDVPGREDPRSVRVFVEPPRTDVLLVVDDGPDSAALQARLVASFDVLVQRAREQGNDVRVAVTTTSMSDALCEPEHGAVRGAFGAQSCLDRLDDFIGPDGTDARALCTDRCEYTTEQLGLSPARPWLGLLDLPAGVEPAAALACLVPQGISGCARGAPLEAVELARRRSDQEGEPEHGFFRVGEAGHAVVLTDGVDCSLTDTGLAAFDPEGTRALWSDPEADAATLAVCWNAGVECQGDASGYDDCAAVDRGLDGEPISGDTEPVLESIERYEYAASELTIHVVAGVPAGSSEPVYSAVGDPVALLEHGIDPGCTDAELAALPPVRLRELAAELASVCAPDYAELLGRLPVDEPLCVRPCAAAALEVRYEAPGEAPVVVPECEVQDRAFVVPGDAPACHAVVPEAPECAGDPGGSTALVIRAVDFDVVPAFILTPDPWWETPGCTT